MASDDIKGLESLGKATEGVPVGSVLASILPPKAFLAHSLPKNGWMYANGDSLQDQKSPLATFMKLNNQNWYDDELVNKDVAHVPNLQGAFLRSIDSEKGGRDPDKVRKIGNYQGDSFAKHHHDFGTSTQCTEDFRGAQIPKPGGSSFSTTDQGGDETRPKNVALYFYVRVL